MTTNVRKPTRTSWLTTAAVIYLAPLCSTPFQVQSANAFVLARRRIIRFDSIRCNVLSSKYPLVLLVGGRLELGACKYKDRVLLCSARPFFADREPKMPTDGLSQTANTEAEIVSETEPDSAAEAAVAFGRLVGRLKTTPRTGWVRRGVPRYESVADHSWRVAALCLLLADDDDGCENGVDVAKCMQLAVVHDLAECLVGDIAPDDNVSKADKQRLEKAALASIASTLENATPREKAKNKSTPTPPSALLLNLFHEYEDRKSDESLAVKDLDLLDMILQASEYEERFAVNLQDFFDGTPTSRFQNAKIKKVAQQVHCERRAYQENKIEKESNVVSRLSKTDTAFLAEYSKGSSLEADAIEQVVRALRQWDFSDRNDKEH